MTPSNRPMPDAIARSVLLVPSLASLVVATTSAVLLGIWLFIPEMKSFSGPTMKPNTALSLLFASGALWLMRQEGGKHVAVRRRWAAIFAAAVVLIGAVS